MAYLEIRGIGVTKFLLMVLKYPFLKYLLIICFLAPLINWSQNIRGKIVNSDDYPLEFAYVSIVTPEDSVLIDATSTNKRGEFELTLLNKISSEHESQGFELENLNKEAHEYKIIAGTFDNPEEARKMVNELSKIGFTAKVAGMNQSGLTRVYIDSINNSLEANNNLERIKTVAPDARLSIEEKPSKSGQNLSETGYIFQVHLVGYKKYQKLIYYKGKTINMGSIALENWNALDEVTVTIVVPISIKKDTISYNTEAFNVKIEDSVEDLLKKLPGIEVDASGLIRAQGEVVSKIFIDGKEFFHGDPALITKNLPAYSIKRVEVIDQKSEKARISGISDSKGKKVVNLKLKEENKVNDFGKLHVGYGTDNRYLTSLNYNRFSSKMQASVIGKYNNVNSSGSDISDLINFNSNGNMSSVNRPGFLTTGIGGFNLGYELKEGQNMNADYFYNYTLATSGDIITNKTELVGNDEINSIRKSSNENISQNHNLNFIYTDRTNDLSSTSFNGSFYSDNNQRDGNSSFERYNGQNELDLQSETNTSSQRTNNSMNLSVQYTRRLTERSKRNFSVSSNLDVYRSTDISLLNQVNSFNISNPEVAFKTLESTDRDESRTNLNFGVNLDYVEPLGKNNYLVFQSNMLFAAIDENVNQTKYENDNLLEPLIFEQYYTVNSTEGGLLYKFDNDRTMLSYGVSILNQNLKFGLLKEEEYSKRYTNLNPQVTFIYRPKAGESWSLNLKKSVRLPRIDQLSPVINNFNTIYIQTGNPLLTPERIVSVSGIHNSYNFKNGFNFFSTVNYTRISNSIVNSEFLDQLGILTSSYENFGAKNNFNIGVRIGKRIESLGLRYSISLDSLYSDYLSIINTEPNETQSKIGSLGFSLENNDKDKIDISLGAKWNKNYTTFSKDSNTTDRDFFQQSYFTKVDWAIADRLNLSSQFKYDIFTDSFFGTDQSVPIWNATASCSPLKSKKLTLLFTALDILNRNVGIVRSSTVNYFEEIQQEVLGNYYLVSLTYKFN
nr:outer membrane beta-barrel protein [Lentiprolixibacter aurantiacus]